MTDAAVKISIRHLYKIFGPRPRSVLEYVKAGMGKTELLERQSHVLGLRDINVEMREGRLTVVMGLSGSGKSTLIRHLNRLIEPTDGEIRIDGVDVMSLSPPQLRALRQSGMSMVFQKFALLPHRTVLENAGTALRVRGGNQQSADAEARKWLARVGLAGVDRHYPHQLSGGMQQRVGIARALTSNAPVMLMDESFSALDPLIRADMQNLLLELQNDLHKTIVFITHDLDEALKIADHLVILKDGSIVQQGEPQSIVLNPCDSYIEAFIGNINRSRVLRAMSVMQPLRGNVPAAVDGDVDCNANLEDVIALSGGVTERRFVVTRTGQPIGVLDMRDLIKALVPRPSTAAIEANGAIQSRQSAQEPNGRTRTAP